MHVEIVPHGEARRAYTPDQRATVQTEAAMFGLAVENVVRGSRPQGMRPYLKAKIFGGDADQLVETIRGMSG